MGFAGQRHSVECDPFRRCRWSECEQGRNRNSSSLGYNEIIAPDEVKKRLAALRFIDRRITMGRVIVIKATKFRTQERNRTDAMERLDDLLLKAQRPQKLRHPTRPTLASIRKRLDDKLWHGRKKELRKKIKDWD